MADTVEPGFRLPNGTFYAFAYNFDLFEQRLIKRCTDVPFEEWAAAFDQQVDDPDTAGLGSDVLTGLIAVALHRGQPGWGLERLEREVGRVHLDELEWVTPPDTDEEPAADAVPPVVAAPEAATSPVSSETSNGSPGSQSESTPLVTSGLPGSATT